MYLSANQVYCVVSDDCKDIISVGEHNKTLFETRTSLVNALRGCGLSIGENGVIENKQ